MIYRVLALFCALWLAGPGLAPAQNLPGAAGPMLPTTSSIPARTTLVQSRIPMILPSSGSMANNGALTLTTALDQTYPNAYFYMPANAIVAGSTAGFYYGTMASTTTATLFNNAYVSGTPTIPAGPTAFATTGPGAYAQTTGALFTANAITITGNSLGVNDEIQVHGVISYPNSAGAKTLSLTYGAFSYAVVAPTTTATQAFQAGFALAGKASRQGQTGNTAMTVATIAGAYVNGSVDSTTDQGLSAGIKTAAVADYIILQSYTAEWVHASPN